MKPSATFCKQSIFPSATAMTHKPYKTTSSRIAWSSPWYRVRQDEIITPDGKPGVYNVVEKEDAVWIVPVTADHQIVLIKNYRYTVDDWCLEVPAGSIEPEHADIAETARVELLEEVGGVAEEMVWIGRFYVANGIFNEIGHIFLATGVTLSQHQREATEVMEIHPTPIAQALTMARTLQIQDGASALALLACETHLQALL
jgi:ADP-ribose pyrophosphatase